MISLVTKTAQEARRQQPRLEIHNYALTVDYARSRIGARARYAGFLDVEDAAGTRGSGIGAPSSPAALRASVSAAVPPVVRHQALESVATHCRGGRRHMREDLSDTKTRDLPEVVSCDGGVFSRQVPRLRKRRNNNL